MENEPTRNGKNVDQNSSLVVCSSSGVENQGYESSASNSLNPALDLSSALAFQEKSNDPRITSILKRRAAHGELGFTNLLQDLVKKHSEFISYPIYLWTGKTTEKEFSDEEDDEIEKEEEGDIEEVDEEKENDKGEKKKIKEVAQEWQIINKQKPIGLRKPEEITKDEYAADYKRPTINWEYRLTVEHFSVEDQLEFKAIYYATGESKKAGENYPSLERIKKKGYEITYMVGAIDEYTYSWTTERI
ncbi:heat shock protein 83-like [Dorcoceras hygrometricum]|uniref:Heat shock protein 83-like n=1 Tax=Dorcoceras hygrometricum TaxID=472368 RepID=A0A2Z7A4P0_9LAMI|nr:heat shock protein 83-like [Dorcoceras hygrometricum]